MSVRHIIFAAAIGLSLLWLPSFAAPPPAPKPPPIEELPAKAPDWPAGYRFRWPLQVVGDPAKETTKSVIASIPTGGWLKADASDLIVRTASGDVLPIAVLSHDPAGDTIIQFPRHENDAWYWAYGGNADAPAPTKFDSTTVQEGMTLELREWAGDDLDSWAKVSDGLKKSESVIGNAIVAEVIQNSNPARPDQPRNFAASYRGYLDIKQDGAYRFFVNGDDATFLFIDNLKVFERPGSNRPQGNKFPLNTPNGQIELKAGIHPIEVHHVVGNSQWSYGLCTLLWIPAPDPVKPPPANQPVKLAFVPRRHFVQPMLARAAAAEEKDGSAAPAFSFGMDDGLSAGGLGFTLARFNAPKRPDADKLTWDFGDGTGATGPSTTHVYFKNGTYTVDLKTPSGTAFHRKIQVWPGSTLSSPLSLSLAVKSLAASDWKKGDVQRVRQMFTFLQSSEQEERWPLLEAVTERLLAEKGLELKDRADLTVVRIEALAQIGKTTEALKVADQLLADLAKVPSLKVRVQLAAASVHQYQLKDAGAASRLYKAILDDNRRLEHPNLRLAALRWGDLFAESGDLPRAAETYRLAATLGGEQFLSTAQADAPTRGARLRIAELALKNGDVRQTRQLLEKMELDFPEQKLEGPYRFLRAEADRFGGRYEEALRNYEVLIRLPQWAGYRDKALHGIADSHYRMGQLERSLEWLGTLHESFPKYFEKQKLADVQKLIEARIARAKAQAGGGFFTGFTIGFGPDEKAPQQVALPVTRGLGMQGDYVGVLSALQEKRREPPPIDFAWPVRDMTGDGTYWVEFWYRETMGAPAVHEVYAPFIWVWFSGDGLPNTLNPTTTQIVPERTYGQWRKLGFKLKAPLATDGQLRMQLRGLVGVMEIDALSIRPVTDRQLDSLTSFLEGPEKQP